jgi:hypothetical protein
MLLLASIEKILLDPYPVRSAYLWLAKALSLGTYPHRVEIGAVARPAYGYCLYQGCRLAKRLGIDRVSALEFGVAGGNGLLNLEYHAREIERSIGVKVDIFGFDNAVGLPPPIDFRDLPYHWQQGFYKMDEAALRRRLQSSQLVLGDVRETLKTFLDVHKPAPIAAVVIDLDFYSSTATALELFSAMDDRFVLPRAFFYFDDIIGALSQLYSDFTGERLAIREFNERCADRKFSPVYYLLAQKAVAPWCHAIRVLHSFHHQRYNDFTSGKIDHLTLS